jgi:pyruvate-ferredoxin/flavodoxin oxidoreductase
VQIARRLAEGLMRVGGGSAAVAELLASLPAVPAAAVSSNGANAPAPAAVSPAATAVASAPAPAAVIAPVPASIVVDDEDEGISLEAHIDSVLCTTCNECTNFNNKIFAYNADKQAYIKDASAGTYQQLVLAAEKCPVSIIHPGTPLNPKEKDLEKWVKRAERFN